MDKIITYNFTENLIARLADYIKANFLNRTCDLSRVAVVFGGRRPALFLKKELAARIKTSYFPPKIFSIEDFIRYIALKKSPFRMATELDACYLIFCAARDKTPGILRGRKEFSQFLPWAREIAGFIDGLDLEAIPEDRLKAIEESAGIGYEIPESFNELLKNIVAIRDLYHDSLRSRGLYSRGLLYKESAEIIKEESLSEFDKVLFCDFYYLQKSEEAVIKRLYDKDKAVLFFQKDQRQWPVFKELSETFGCAIEPEGKPAYTNEPKIFKGFDSHSQVGLVRHILQSEGLIKDKGVSDTLILLCEPQNLIPLLSEISALTDCFNVSMGYPLKRNSLYSLMQYVFKAQSSRKDGKYYAKDYLKVLLHPLLKNLMFTFAPELTRVLCHKVEEILLGMIKTPLSGSIFISLKEIEDSGELFTSAADTLAHIDLEVKLPEIKEIITQIHMAAFYIWEDISNFTQFISSLEEFNKLLLEKSFLDNHPLNTKFMEKIFEIQDELSCAEFKDQPFSKEDIFKIFEAKLESEKISFSGSPLKGLQVLELLETRALTFKNVIVMDANESVLPRVRVYEPLIPRQIMESLGLKRLKQEEDIQRYLFMRLVGGAKNVYFVFDDNPEKEKSRFIEEIIWDRQKELKALNVLQQQQARFNISGIQPERLSIRKNKNIVSCLSKDFAYSASSIDTYINCPAQFYYQYVLRLKEKQSLLDALEARDIGDFLHKLLDQAFSAFLNVRPMLNAEFEKRFFEEFNRRFDKELSKRTGAESFMVKDIMAYRLKRFLYNEKSRQVKKIMELEEDRTGSVFLADREVNFKYRIDRVDLLEDDSILIIDYKSGSSPVSPAALGALEKMEFSRRGIKDTIHSFQMPVYCYFTAKRYPDSRLNAALYSLRKAELNEFIRAKDMDNTAKVMQICLKALEFVVAEILNPQVDFEADDRDERACAFCPFRHMCN